MVGLKFHSLTLLLLAIMAACVPEPKKVNNCGPNETVNTTLRTCVSSSAYATNRRPIGTDQTVTMNEDTLSSQAASDFILELGTDQDNDTLNYVLVTPPRYGTLTSCMNLSSSTGLTDRVCKYVPNSNFYGTDTFQYKINDGFQDSSSYTTVTINVTGVNDAPIVSSRYGLLYVLEGTTTTYTFSYSDPEGDIVPNGSCVVANGVNLTINGVAPSCTCDVLGVCTASITPTAYLNSSSAPITVFSFDYSLTDDGTPIAASVAGTETLFVTAVDDTPLITTAPDCTAVASTPQNTALSCALPVANALTLDSTNGDSATWSIDALNTTCAWEVGPTINSSTGEISGTPDDDDVNATGCTIGIKLTDANGHYSSATITGGPIVITNAAPELSSNGTLNTITEDPTTAAGRLVATVSSASTCVPANGLVCLNAAGAAIDRIKNGTLTTDHSDTTCDDADKGRIDQTIIDADTVEIYFTPVAHFASTCNIRFDFDDGNPATNTDSLTPNTVTVTPVNDAPTFSVPIPDQTINEASQFIVDSNISSGTTTPIIIDEGGGDDEDGQDLTVTISSDNTSLFAHATSSIMIYNSAVTLDSTSAFGWDSQTASEIVFDAPTGDQDNMYILLTPIVGQTGTANITITLTDSLGLTATDEFKVVVTNKAAIHKDWTNIKAVGRKILADGTPSTNKPTVTLGWNAFTVYNTGISGYNVYRSTSSTGPFINQINTSTISATARTFTDTTLPTTLEDATINTDRNYYYRVKAVATDGSVIDTSSTYSAVRVRIPYDNMALVHRRIANYEACIKMSETPDPTNHNRCVYVGPGDASGYYDIGTDYLVDRYEASCNYSLDSRCTNSMCLGSGAPAAIAVGSEAIYYDRASGTCYYSPTGAAWTAVTSLTLADFASFKAFNQETQETTPKAKASTFPLAPPLVHIGQQQAHQYCTGITPAKSLVSRIVQIAASAWPSTVSQVNQETREQGASLSYTTSQCNSSDGANLTYDDALISVLEDTWSGMSATTSPRFVMSGSTVTSSCSSRYDIQDLIGNVDEWNLDRFHAGESTNDVLYSIRNVDPDTSGFVLNSSYDPYRYNSNTLAFSIDETMGTPLIDYEFESGFSNLPNIFLPMGMPAANVTSSDAVSGLNLNNDYVTYRRFFGGADVAIIIAGNDDSVVEDSELYGVASGGHFSDETASGRYSLRFRSVCHDTNTNNTCGDIPADITASGTEPNVYTGFRCMISEP